MKKLLFSVITPLLLSVCVQAQDILHATAGSVITVQTGATLFVGGDITLDNTSTLNNAGTITIARAAAPTANFTDNTPAPHSYGNGKFIFTGAGGAQNMLGSLFYDLEVNNAAGVNMLASNTVNNNLVLTSGFLSLAGNTLSINGPVTGTGNLKGSATSSLVVGGNAGTINFNQTDSFSRSLKNFTLNNGIATLGNAAQIYEVLGLTASTFHVNGQSLVLKSKGNGSTNTARVANLTGSTLDGATNVTVERYIASPQRAWHLLSTQAVTGSQTIKQAWQENGGAIVAGQGTLITSNLYNAGNGFDMVSNSSSILTHNQGGNSGPSYNYNLANTNSTAISANPGYMLFVRGDRNFTAANAPSTSPTVLRTNGTLNQGNKSVFISSTGSGRTLVANPYPSPIDMENIFAATTNLAPDMYIWDPALTGNFGVGGYRLVQRTAANTYQQTPVVLGGTVTDATARYIHSGQAFFLRTIGTAGTTDATVQFTEAVKAASVSVVNPIVAGVDDEQLIVNLMLVNGGNIESLADGIRIRFNDSYTTAITDDVEKMGNFAENISSFRESKKLIVENRPMIHANDTIFLRLTNTGIKDYRFQLGTLNFVQPEVTAWLQDNYLNTSTPVDLSGAVNNIDFNISSIAASADPDRFRIVFKLSGPLPISITSIKAYQQNSEIAVEWKVSSELNMKNYEVEKSTDGINFAKMFTQPATANNGSDIIYKWIDVNPVTGNNFYRIKGIDNSTASKYSAIANVFIGKTAPAISIFPNPVTGTMFSVQFTAMEKGIYQLRLINLAGQVVSVDKLVHAGGNVLQTVAVLNLASGEYQLQIVKPDNSVVTKPLIIVR
jgi:Secretion system C-terminal sorting domain